MDTLVSRNLFNLFIQSVVAGRRVVLSACAAALVSCGGGQSGPAAPVDSVGPAVPAGAESADGPSIALNPPGTVGQGNRIGLTWQAPSSLASFTVFVQRAAGLGFEAVDAAVAGNSAQFARGASWKLDFPTARVRVRGCDASNQCVDSNEQPLLDALLTGLARLTTSADVFEPLTNPKFSADGNTLAVWAGTTGPPIEGQECAGRTGGSVLVFHRNGDGRWIQEANLNRFSVPGGFGLPLALSGDGNTLIAAASGDSGTVGGINPPEIGTVFPPDLNIQPDARGAIHVYIRDAQHQWSHQAFIKPAVTVANEAFGARVEVTHDGNRVLVGARDRMYLFDREAGQWRQAKKIFESAPGSLIDLRGMAISANGSAIAVRTIGARQAKSPQELPPFAVRVYTPCNCDDGWRQVADLRSAKPDTFFDQQFGATLSFSGDGTTLAVGAPGDGEPDPFSSFPAVSGAVYIFAADGGAWQQRAFLKARVAEGCDGLGKQVALSGDGKVLAAWAIGRASDLIGLDTRADGLRRNHRADATTGLLHSGCLGEITGSKQGASFYVFEADESGSWSHTAVALPAPGEDIFASSLAMSADAQTLGMSVQIFPKTSGGLSTELVVY